MMISRIDNYPRNLTQNLDPCSPLVMHIFQQAHNQGSSYRAIVPCTVKCKTFYAVL